MSAGALMLTIAGLLVAGGAVGVIAAVRGTSFLPPTSAAKGTSTGRRPGRLRPTWRHLWAIGAGVAVLLVTGWPVATIGAAAGVLFIPSVLGGGKAARDEVARAEALAEWTRRLADLIMSGSFGSTREAIRRSARSVPDPIAGPVAALVARMDGPGGSEMALRRFADDLADPAAEQIAAVLILRERNGGPGLAQVLTERSEDVAEWARMLRDVEAERAKPRANLRTVLGCTGVLLVGALLFMRPFLSAYSSPLGELALAGVVAVFATSLRWIRSLAIAPTTPRILITPAATTAVDGVVVP